MMAFNGFYSFYEPRICSRVRTMPAIPNNAREPAAQSHVASYVIACAAGFFCRLKKTQFFVSVSVTAEAHRGAPT